MFGRFNILRALLVEMRREFTTLGGTSFKKADPWAKLRRKKWPSDYALENYDVYYAQQFGNTWPSVRLGLLCQQKYCAIVNNYANVDQTAESLESYGAIDIRRNFDAILNEMRSSTSTEQSQSGDDLREPCRSHSSDDYLEELFPIEPETPTINVDEDDRLRFKPSGSVGGDDSIKFNEFVPATKLRGLEDFVNETDYTSTYKYREQVPLKSIIEKPRPLPFRWKVYAYERGDVRLFRPPRRGPLGVLDYYLMDAASLLPVFALNIQDNDQVLDLCAAPGGKALAMIQTQHSVDILCNDVSATRTNRLHDVMHAYVPSYEKAYSRVKITTVDGQKLDSSQCQYNKILVDVPCTTDRHSANENEDNIFHPIRAKERIRLPEVQTKLLCAALKAVRPGGSVVYSTCTLSPIQNDGVVHMALHNVLETSSGTFIVHDLSELFHPFKKLFQFYNDPSPRYGQLVVPFLPKNFGPMYVCKFSKLDE